MSRSYWANQYMKVCGPRTTFIRTKIIIDREQALCIYIMHVANVKL